MIACLRQDKKRDEVKRNDWGVVDDWCVDDMRMHMFSYTSKNA